MNTQIIYDRITSIIIEMLENHKQNNFSESWISLSSDSIFAQNAISKHTYSGINQLLLNYLGRKYNHTFNSWMTFKQLSKLEGRIKKGSKAAMVVYKSVLYLDKKTSKNITKLVEHLLKSGQSIEHLDYKKLGYLKQYNVFNISQIEKLPDEYYKLNDLENLTEFEKDERAEHVINSTGANIVHSPQNDAFYRHSEDKIYLPERKQFISKEAYYSVLAHECSHWTGHKSRLDRPIENVFGSEKYSFEEILAEISSAFIMAYLGYENRITDNVDYIDNWLSVMKNDKQFIIQASSQAQKSADYILAFSKAEKVAV